MEDAQPFFASGNFGDVVIDGGHFRPGAFDTNTIFFPSPTSATSLTLAANATYEQWFLPFGESHQLSSNPTTVNGNVSLGGAAFSCGCSGLQRTRGEVFYVIDNRGSAPVAGTFAALPEGSTAGDFTISYKGGDGNDVVLVVAGIPTATTLASSQNPSPVGQPITFTATVTGAQPPAGTVTFFDGATALDTEPLSGGMAAFTTSSLAIGSHGMTAQYSGDAKSAPSTSAVLTQQVNGAVTVFPPVLTLGRGTSGGLIVDAGNPVPSTQTLGVTASDPCISVPSSVDIAAGARQALITVSSVGGPCNARVDIALPPSLGGTTISAGVRVFEILTVTFDPPQPQIAVGQTIQVRVNATPLAAPVTLPLTSSSNVEVPAAVNVDSTGGSFTIKGLATGSFIVTATLPPQFGGGTVSLFGNVVDATATPAFLRVSPASGSILGGTTVRIAGTALAADCWAAFDGVPAHHVSVLSPTEMIATTPAHAAGAVAVTPLCSAGNGAALSGAFTYVAAADPAPAINAVNPSSAPPGQDVTISGSHFRFGDSVTFGATPATVRSVTPDTLVVRVPWIAAGNTVLAVDGTAGPAFTVLPAVTPRITNVTPSTVGPGGELTIDGTGFGTLYSFRIGGAAAATMLVSFTRAEVRVPRLPNGSYAVELVNANGDVLANGGNVTVSSAGVVVSAAPLCVTTTGGAAIVIRGSGFAEGATVTIGGIAATNVHLLDAGRLAVTTPALPPGPATIVVTNPKGDRGTATNAVSVYSPFDPDGCAATPRPRPTSH